MILKTMGIILDKLRGKKKDYFIDAKYTNINQYYGSKVLDIGAGNGDFSAYLKTQGHTVMSLDVVDKCRHNSLDFRVFDGKTIPHPDKSIDTSLALFVLHHTNNQEQLLRELKRVTKNHIIVGEDVINNTCDMILGNIHLNTAPWAKGKDSFRTDAGWTEIFKKLGLSIENRQVIRRSEYPVYPIQRIVYTLSLR